MENLKIRVNSKAESKEAQELFFDLGFAWNCGGAKVVRYLNMPYLYAYSISKDMTFGREGSNSKFINNPNKEITLPELRDLVVLKRNSIDDANAFRHDNGVNYYITSDNKYYYFSNIPTFEWTKSCNDIDYLEKHVKPIEKPMKEYLRKNSNGTYSYIGTVRPEHVSDFMIEIPKTAELVLRNKQGKIEFFKDKCGSKFENGNWIGVSIPFARLQGGRILFLKGGCQAYWDSDFSKTLAAPFNLIESRHTLPEELPFIDDESPLGSSKIGRRAITVKIPVESLNDQYAEIETVRQSAWQKQEGGSHYKNLKIQPMQYALENKLDYAQANVVKYVTRHKEKNGKEDLLKAIHNLELMIEFYYGGGE